MIKRCHGMFLGGFRFVVILASYGQTKKQQVGFKEGGYHYIDYNLVQQMNFCNDSASVSFADIIKGNMGEKKVSKVNSKPKDNIVYHTEEEELKWLSKCTIGVLRNSNHFSNLNSKSGRS